MSTFGNPPGTPGTPINPPGPPANPPGPPEYPSYPGQPAASSPAPRKAPMVVTVASAILFILGLLGLLNGILSLIGLGTTTDRFHELGRRVANATPQDIDNQVTQLRVQTIVGAIIGLLIALLLIGLAFWLLKGSNTARIITWVLCGIGALCACCSGVSLFALSGLNRVTVSGDAQAEKQVDLAKALVDSVPGWQKGLGGTVSVLQLLGYLAVAILLALPAANAFFKRVAPVWQPPTT
jgi:hypothetical protein